MTEFDDLVGILEDVPKPALYEQLAEESVELAKAALKMSRVIRGENPTPVTQEEAVEMVGEELSDLFTVCAVLNVGPEIGRMMPKMRRWAGRLNPNK